jgi:hypothetical protein
MDVKEVQERATKLDEAIATLVRDFQQQTGCDVTEIDLENLHRAGMRGNSLPIVKCQIELRS